MTRVVRVGAYLRPMNYSQVRSGRSSSSAGHPRPRPPTRPVAVPATRAETLELRDLLEANLEALRILHREHRQMLAISLRTIDGARPGLCPALRDELRHALCAIADARAPWVQALSESRALLFVALRELIAGAEAELTMPIPQQEPADPHHRSR